MLASCSIRKKTWKKSFTIS